MPSSIFLCVVIPSAFDLIVKSPYSARANTKWGSHWVEILGKFQQQRSELEAVPVYFIARISEPVPLKARLCASWS